MEVWKRFEDTELTHSGIHHLLAIHELKKEHGYARSVDVSKHLRISRGSASITLRKLKDKGFLQEDDNKFYSLTDAGEQLINNTLTTRRIVKKFFSDFLELPEEIAMEDSCKIEHLISSQTAESLVKFMGYFMSKLPEFDKLKHGYHKFAKHCKASEACDYCETECFFQETVEKSH